MVALLSARLGNTAEKDTAPEPRSCRPSALSPIASRPVHSNGPSTAERSGSKSASPTDPVVSEIGMNTSVDAGRGATEGLGIVAADRPHAATKPTAQQTIKCA